MGRTLTAAVFAVIASLALAGTALAANVGGTSAGDTLRGTGAADSIRALGGNDRVRARSGSDRVSAGRGADRVVAGAGSDRVNGGAGPDLLLGNAGADVITGGPGADIITGGDGNDVIDAGDGVADTVTCGLGIDVAKLDEVDVIADATAENPNGSCETVLRGGSPLGSGARSGRDCPEPGAASEAGALGRRGARPPAGGTS